MMRAGTRLAWCGAAAVAWHAAAGSGGLADEPRLNQVWSDEFDDAAVSGWSRADVAPGAFNNELQAYTPNASASFALDGVLHIVASDGSAAGSYTSARLSSNFSFRYGFAEVRLKLPSGPAGLWPAAWLLPVTDAYGAWPRSGEIDMVELATCSPGVLHFTVHTDAYNHMINTQATVVKDVGANASSWDVLTLHWTEHWVKISSAVAGQDVFAFYNDGRGNSTTWPFDRAFRFLLNVAVGGSMGATCLAPNARPALNDTAEEARSLLVDYVRVFNSSGECAKVGGAPTEARPCCFPLVNCSGAWVVKEESITLCAESEAHCAAKMLFGKLPEPPCTARGFDPYMTGTRVECCGTDVACVKNWEPSAPGWWFFLCSKSQAHCDAKLVDGVIPGPKTCAARGEDPWLTGTELPCCGTNIKCVKNWEPSNPDWWFFKCVETQPHCDAKMVEGTICSGVGADPNATGTVLPCCQQFSACSRNWTDGVTSTRCVNSDFDCQLGQVTSSPNCSAAFDDPALKRGNGGQDALPACHHDPSAFSSQYGECFARMNWLTVNWDRGDSKEFYANSGVDGSWCSAQIFLSTYETFCPRCACVDGTVAAPGVVVPPDSQYRSCCNSASSFVTATLATSNLPCASGQSCKLRAGSNVAYCIDPACGDLSVTSVYDKLVFHREEPGHACCARYGASACAPWQRCVMWNAPGSGIQSRCENEDVLLDVMVAVSAATAAGNASACAAAALRANDTSLEAGSGTCWLAAGVRAAAAAVLAVQNFNNHGTAGRACRRLLIPRVHDTGFSVLQTGRLALAAAADESLALVGPGDAVSQGVVATLGGGEGIASLALGEVPPSFASRRDYPFLYAVALDPALAARAVCSLWSSRRLSRATVLLGPGSFLAATSVEVLQACRATGVDVRLANVDFSAPDEAARSAAALDAVYKSGANVFLVLADRAAGARELLAMLRAAWLAGILRAGSTWTFGDSAVAQAAADAAALDAKLAAALDGSLVLDVAPRVAQSFAQRWAAANASHLAAALAAAGGPALGAELVAGLSGEVDPAAAYMYDAVTAAGLAACDALGAEPYLNSSGRVAQRAALRTALPRVSFDGATGRIAFAQGSGLRADAPRVRLLNLVLPPQAGGGRRLAGAALEAVELGEFDSAAEAFTLAREPVFNGGLVAVPDDQVAVRDPDELRVAILQPMGSETGNAWLGPGWQVSTAMALLAVEHFNARRAELAPQLGALVCNKRMRVTLRDTGDSVRRAVEGVFDVAGSHDVIIGPATDAMVDATSSLSGLYRVPQAGFSSTAARAAAAGAQSAASAYFRTAPADDLIAGAICALWRRLGFAHAALIYPETSAGLAYRSALSAACARADLHVEPFPYDPLDGGPEAADALAQRLASSQINVVLFMWSGAGGNVATLASVLLAAFACNLLSKGTSWVLSDASAWEAAQRHAGPQRWQDVLAALAGSLVVRPVAGLPTNPRLAALLASFPQLVAGLGASFAPQLAAQGLPALDFGALPAATVAEALQTHPGLYEFDAIVAAGLAACRVAPQAPLPVAQSEYPDLVLAQAAALDVLGVSGTGSVRFSNKGDRAADTVVYALYNAVREPGQLAHAGTFDSSSGSWNVTGALRFNGLAPECPRAIRPLPEDRQLYGAQVKSIAWVLFGTNFTIAIACLLFTVAFRAHPILKASQVRLTCIVCLGSVITSTTIALLTTEDGDAAGRATGGLADAACVAAAWTYCVGFVISYATLALKQFRIISIFSGILSDKQKRKLTDGWLMRWVGLHVAIDATLCAVWTATDAPRFQRVVTATDKYGNPTQSHGTCASNNIYVFSALVFAHHLGLLVMGAYYSYRSLALNIHGAFSEGKQVRMAVVSALQMFMLSIPVMLLSSSTDATLFVRTMVIFLMDAGTMLLIFTPKALMLVHGVTDDGTTGADMIQKSLSNAGKRSNTSGSSGSSGSSRFQPRTHAASSVSPVSQGPSSADRPPEGSSAARSSGFLGSNKVVPEPGPSKEPEQQNGQEHQ